MGIIDRIIGNTYSQDVTDILKAQHSQVDELFEKLESGEGNKRALFTRLANLLVAHAAVEEKLFYQAVMTKDTNDLLHESVEEHLEVKRLIADLMSVDTNDDTFTAKISVLKENVSHHAHEEEEKKLFPKVRDILDADQRAALGNQVLQMFDEVMANGNVPLDVEKAAQLPAPN